MRVGQGRGPGAIDRLIHDGKARCCGSEEGHRAMWFKAVEVVVKLRGKRR